MHQTKLRNIRVTTIKSPPVSLWTSLDVSSSGHTVDVDGNDAAAASKNYNKVPHDSDEMLMS